METAENKISPSAADKLQSLQSAVISGPESRGHSILVSSVQVFHSGLLQQIQIAINGCLMISRHSCVKYISSIYSYKQNLAATEEHFQPSVSLFFFVGQKGEASADEKTIWSVITTQWGNKPKSIVFTV